MSNVECRRNSGFGVRNSQLRRPYLPVRKRVKVGSAFDGRHLELYVPRTLNEKLRRRGRFSVAKCLDMGLRLSSALVYLHERRLVHRDIKPSNVIFVGGNPKLADIGLVTTAWTLEQRRQLVVEKMQAARVSSHGDGCQRRKNISSAHTMERQANRCGQSS